MPKTKVCSIAGCTNRLVARGLCTAHYLRQRRHGDAHIVKRIANGEAIRWLEEVAVPFTGDDCLVWPYYRDSNGRGFVRHDGRPNLASRRVCEIVNGPPPTPKHEAAHSCGKAHLGCINPKHLRWATPKENRADKLLHDTHNRGGRNPANRLAEADVRRIRALLGKMSHQAIAEQFDIHPSAISKIVTGRTWNWLDNEENGDPR